MQLGKIGVWYFTETLAAAQAAEAAQRIESLGYGAFWLPEAIGRHPFAHAAWLLAKTERLIVATGIANIYARDAAATAAAQKTLAEQSGGRFLLGLGVSHRPMVEAVRGHVYTNPVATMRAYLERMEKAPSTDRAEGAIQCCVCGQVGGGSQRPLNDVSVEIRDHEQLRRERVVGHAARLDDDQPASAVDRARVAEGEAREAETR